MNETLKNSIQQEDPNTVKQSTGSDLIEKAAEIFDDLNKLDNNLKNFGDSLK